MNSTYKNYELIDIGSNKEPGVYKDNKILIKGVHFDIESCYQSEGVILLNKKGDELPCHEFENWVKHWEDTTTKVIPRHPLYSKRADESNLREYFFKKYPDLKQFSDYLKMFMYPTPNVTFEYQGIKELSTESTVYKYDGEEIAISVAEALERAITFKKYADARTAKTIQQ
ncbi:MAG: hypothetical protein ACKPHE_12995 [Microcystis panniformis]